MYILVDLTQRTGDAFEIGVGCWPGPSPEGWTQHNGVNCFLWYVRYMFPYFSGWHDLAKEPTLSGAGTARLQPGRPPVGSQNSFNWIKLLAKTSL